MYIYTPNFMNHHWHLFNHVLRSPDSLPPHMQGAHLHRFALTGLGLASVPWLPQCLQIHLHATAYEVLFHFICWKKQTRKYTSWKSQELPLLNSMPFFATAPATILKPTLTMWLRHKTCFPPVGWELYQNKGEARFHSPDLTRSLE
jgi:hypothetical protein